jgi:hypothetical protein
VHLLLLPLLWRMLRQQMQQQQHKVQQLVRP